MQGKKGITIKIKLLTLSLAIFCHPVIDLYAQSEQLMRKPLKKWDEQKQNGREDGRNSLKRLRTLSLGIILKEFKKIKDTANFRRPSLMIYSQQEKKIRNILPKIDQFINLYNTYLNLINERPFSKVQIQKNLLLADFLLWLWHYDESRYSLVVNFLISFYHLTNHHLND